MTIDWKKIFRSSLVTVCLFSSPAFAAQGKLIDKTVAIVNQESILLSEYDEFRIGLEAELKLDPKNKDVNNPEKFRERALEQMIEDKLLDQEIKGLGLEATDAQIENTLDSVMKDNGLRSRKELDRVLKKEGLTYDQLVTQYKRRISRGNLVNQMIRPKIKISEDEIQAEYQKRTKDNKPLTQYNIAMIYVPGGDEKRAKVEKLKLSIKTISDFQKAAKENSEGPAKDTGGTLGWINPNEMQEPLATEVKKLKKGEFSDLIRTDAGYYLLACTDTRSALSKDDEKIRTQIEDEIMNTMLMKNLNQYIVDLRRKAHIEKFL